MLCELTVDGLGVIDHAELGFPGGLIALTGETGAGKTLIVAALGLLLGDRADRSLIRSGSPRALVEGRFSLEADRPLAPALADSGYLDGSEEIVISREVFRDDRPARARINGRMATVAMLAELGPSLVDVAGQHEHQRLADAAQRRGLLDAFAGADARQLAQKVRALAREAAAAEAQVVELRRGLANRERELDILRFEAAEIAKVDVTPGEIARLKQQAAIQESAQAVMEATAIATELLGGDDGAQERLAAALAALEKVRGVDPSLADLADRLAEVTAQVADLSSDAARLAPPRDPGSLEATRARLNELSKLVRKYGTDPDAVSEEESILRHLRRAQDRIAELEAIDDEIDGAESRAAATRKDAETAARSLSALRASAKPRLDDAVEALLERLAMKGARFETHIEPRELYEGGLETVDFFVAANPGDEPRPIAKVASGGELSRIALALHVVTTTAGAGTMVFDEVDAGVGGRAAQSVGRALVDLARTAECQVIVVTHLPQVAAFADAHYRVVKSASGAAVERVDGSGRVEELSRMLAGLPESKRAREHAEELLVLASDMTES